MSKFVLTPRARLDLLNIWNHIAEDSTEAADKVRNKIRDALRLLADMPGIGHEREELADSSHKCWTVFSYVIVYRWKTKPLQIVRIVHGSRDLAALLN